MKKETVEKILAETEKGYDLISEKFSATRKGFWNGLDFILDFPENGDKVLDFGCGNGRLLGLLNRKNIDYFGVDISKKLINSARNSHLGKNAQFLKISSSQTSLPFEDNFFNVIYSIAVFHHIPSEKLRLEIARELFRTLKPGGVVVVTVWNLWQKKYLKSLKRIIKNWFDKLVGKSELGWKDCRISFQDDQGRVFDRYHRAFSKNEFRELFSRAGFKVEKCEIINGRNILIIGKK